MRHKNFKGDVHLVPMRTKKKIDMFMPKLLFRDKKKKKQYKCEVSYFVLYANCSHKCRTMGFLGSVFGINNQFKNLHVCPIKKIL